MSIASPQSPTITPSPSGERFAVLAAGTFATSVVALVASVGTSIIVARWLGPEGKGSVLLMLSVPMLLFSWAGGSLGLAGVHYIASDKLSEHEVFANAMGWSLVVGGVAGFGCLLVVPPGSGYWEHSGYAVWLIPPATIVFFALSICRQCLTGKLHVHQRNLIILTETVLYALGTVGALLLLPYTVASGVLYCVAAAIAGRIVALALVYRLARQRIRFAVRLEWHVLRMLLRYGIAFSVLNALAYLNQRGNVFLLSYFRNDAVLGQFSVGANMAEWLGMIPVSATVLLFPIISANTHVRNNLRTLQITRNTIALVAVLSIVAAVAAPWLIPLMYGDRFTASVAPLWAMLPGVVLLVPFRTLMTDCVARGQFRLPILAIGLGLAFNLALNCLLIPRDGWYGNAVGAGLAATASYGVMGVFFLAAYTRDWKISLRDLTIPTKADVAAYQRILGEAAGRVAPAFKRWRRR